ncbi:hypothetical protein [Kutzneria chonburiensis]|uniref:Uncharacterized protein n=1 Tax=Kutzneria chonburiensis TaxID=1483604 RepID=A0ABV6N6R6_9PSEU
MDAMEQWIFDDRWFELDGAVLLKGWHASYHGDRARFTDTTGYELAVNGRGIPDLDLAEEGEARAERLRGRGVAFAEAALKRAEKDLPHVEVVAYVSVSPTLFDPDRYTGNVTFCAVRQGDPPYPDAIEIRQRAPRSR